MEAYFFIEIALQLVAMKEHLDASLEFAGQAHRVPLMRSE
jgi:hypothetical protein